MSDLQETALTKIRGEGWEISTSDTTFKNLMRRRGYSPASDDGLYEIYKIPANAITVRGRAGLGTRKGNPASLSQGKRRPVGIDSSPQSDAS